MEEESPLSQYEIERRYSESQRRSIERRYHPKLRRSRGVRVFVGLMLLVCAVSMYVILTR